MTVLLMEVTHCEEQWHEADLRQRQWVGVSKVLELVSKAELRHFVNVANCRIVASRTAP